MTIRLQYTLEEWEALPENERPEGYVEYTVEYGPEELRGQQFMRHPDLAEWKDPNEITGLQSALKTERDQRKEYEKQAKGNRPLDEDAVASLKEEILGGVRQELDALRQERDAAKQDASITRALQKAGADPVLSAFIRERMATDDKGAAIFRNP